MTCGFVYIEVDSAELGKAISATLTKFMNQLQSKDEKYSNKEEIQKKMFLQFQEYIKDEKSCNIICNALANPPKNSFGDFVLNNLLTFGNAQERVDMEKVLSPTIDAIIAKNGKDKKLTIVEIGAGPGELAQLLMDKYKDNIETFIIFDISDNAVESLKKRFEQDVKNGKMKVYLQDFETATDKQCKDNSADIVYMLNCWYFFNNVNKCGEQFARVLKSQGYLIGGHSLDKTSPIVAFPKTVFKNRETKDYLAMLEKSGFDMKSVQRSKRDNDPNEIISAQLQ